MSASRTVTITFLASPRRRRAPTMTPALRILAAKEHAGVAPAQLTAEWYAADCPPLEVIAWACQQLESKA